MRADSTEFDYPRTIDIKVFARSDADVRARVREILLQHLQPAALLDIRTRASRQGNYQALSCKVRADNQAQMDDVFRQLSRQRDILMVI